MIGFVSNNELRVKKLKVLELDLRDWGRLQKLSSDNWSLIWNL